MSKLRYKEGGVWKSIAPSQKEFDDNKAEVTASLTDKATKMELQQVSLAYKESYATLATLQSAYPTGNVYNHAVLSDGMIYTYVTSWVSTGIQANGTGIADGTVTGKSIVNKTLSLEKTESVAPIALLKLGKNIYNKNSTTAGYYVNNLDGALVINASYHASDYILVKPNSTYTRSSGTHKMALYDVDKKYVSGVEAGIYTFTTPSNAYYMRTGVNAGNVGTVQVEEGTATTTFEEYGYTLADASLNGAPVAYSGLFDKVVKDASLTNKKIVENTLTLSKIESQEPLVTFEVGKNKFNKTAAIPNYYISSDNGTLLANVAYHVSPFILIKPNKSYTRTRAHKMAFYDINKTFISGDATTGTITFTTPTNAYYLRFGLTNGDLNLVQLEEGSSGTILSPYITTTNKSATGKNIMLLGDSITAIGISDRGWAKYFSDVLLPKSLINVAVSGATWGDKVGTPAYDGNPIQDAEGLNNVLGNQVQKVINGGYASPDVIIIAAGINDIEGYTMSDTQIESEFFNNNAKVPVGNANRTNFAGAIRYSVEKLRELYPNAQIFLCTPLQRNDGFTSAYPAVKEKGDLIKKIGQRLSVPVIDSMESGVYGLNAIGGSPTLDHSDGLHLSATGAEKVGKYNARKIINWFCF